MNDAPSRSFTHLAIAIVAAAVIVSASVLSYASFESTVTKTSTSTEASVATLLQTATTTTTSTITSTTVQENTASGPSENSQRMTLLNNIWNFTASVNTSEVSQAQSVFVIASLTNISPVNQTISELVQPTIYPSVYASNGSQVWTWEPAQSTWPNYTIGRGQSLGETVSVPTSGLSVGQVYTIRISPISIATAGNMTITMNFQLTSGSSVSPSNGVFLLDVNGTWYWADNISNDIVIGSAGYSYFLNGSVMFDGLTFQTICPPAYRGCPGSNSSSTMVSAQVVQLNIKFPDGSNETVGRAGYFEPLPTYILTIDHTSPRAGIVVEYVGDYPQSSVPYAVFLLVSSCGGPPHLC